MVNPLDKDFDYVQEFQKLDVNALKADLRNLLTDSQEWWPADYGNYGPFFIRMTWHIAGTYRVFDGRGGGGAGNQRFAAINSWPDNANLDKARRLLWPIKQKYGQSISWADLLMLVGNVAYDSMGFKTMGFAFGRRDIWEASDDINWGAEMDFGSNDERYHNGGGDGEHDKPDLDKPLGADQMGWIYVNPEGWDGKPDPLLSAKDIRETFARMAMNDEETVALSVGGHTYGKSHGNGDPSKVGPPPEAADITMQGLGWKNDNGSGKGPDAVGSGIEGAWTETPTQWDNNYLKNLFQYDWELTKSPAGSHQWRPKNGAGEGTVPDAHDPNTKHAPMMMTSDIALRADPVYEKIARRFYENPAECEEAFRKAWYKLIHRDMGPHQRMLGPDVAEPQPWQDPVPTADHPLIDNDDMDTLKKSIISDSGLSITRLVITAWASASSYRNSDKRGGANGARIRLPPMNEWEVNEPEELAKALEALEKIQKDFNDKATGGKRVSMADMIVLGGVAAVEAAAHAAGYTDATVPFAPGRMDVDQDAVDERSMNPMRPYADGVRNYFTPNLGVKPEEFLVDKAQLLTLTAPEMAVLIGGMRVLGVGAKETSAFTENVGTLTNDFFVNLLDMSNEWKRAEGDESENLFESFDRKTGEKRWTGTRVDLIFGHNAQLRGVAEVYGCADGKKKFVTDFCRVFGKIMHLDRFDLDKYENELAAERVTGDSNMQLSYV